MNLNLLQNIGLSQSEIAIYEILLKNGELPANRIIELSNLKKGDCYNKLYKLKDLMLVEEFDKAKKKHFRLAHPNRLEQLSDAKEQEARQGKAEMRSIMPEILSAYNLSYHQPGVKFFEGKDALDILLNDSLKSKTDILAYIDLESIDKHLGKRATWYTKNRLQAGIDKYNLVFESSYNREVVYGKPLEHTFEKLVDLGPEMKNISLQIYDNKIIYHNLKPDATIGVIIENPTMANLQRQIWRWMWEHIN